MGIPQIIVITLYAMSFGLYAAKHGQPREDKYNVGAAAFSAAIQLGLLWWGGFFG